LVKFAPSHLGEIGCFVSGADAIDAGHPIVAKWQKFELGHGHPEALAQACDERFIFDIGFVEHRSLDLSNHGEHSLKDACLSLVGIVAPFCQISHSVCVDRIDPPRLIFINHAPPEVVCLANFHQTSAPALVRTNEASYHEDMQTANLLGSHHLAKRIQDAGWSACVSFRAAKAAKAGRRLVTLPPASTSQTCSGCGVVVRQGVSVQRHSRPDPGTGLHRDHNAAKYRARLGQRLRGGVALAASAKREFPG